MVEKEKLLEENRLKAESAEADLERLKDLEIKASQIQSHKA